MTTGHGKDYARVLLKRAEEALSAAQTLLERGLLADAISRAYYAVYYAAQSILYLNGSFSFRVGNRGPKSSGAGNPPLADWLLILYRINGLSFVSMVDLLLRAQSTYFILNDAVGKWHGD
jgi:hypothetical protein